MMMNAGPGLLVVLEVDMVFLNIMVEVSMPIV
jgi:hypothetical protein